MVGLTGIRDLMKICKLLVYFYCQHVKMTMQLCDSTYLKADLCFKWSFEWYLLKPCFTPQAEAAHVYFAAYIR